MQAPAMLLRQQAMPPRLQQIQVDLHLCRLFSRCTKPSCTETSACFRWGSLKRHQTQARLRFFPFQSGSAQVALLQPRPFATPPLSAAPLQPQRRAPAPFRALTRWLAVLKASLRTHLKGRPLPLGRAGSFSQRSEVRGALAFPCPAARRRQPGKARACGSLTGQTTRCSSLSRCSSFVAWVSRLSRSSCASFRSIRATMARGGPLSVSVTASVPMWCARGGDGGEKTQRRRNGKTTQ